MSNVVGAAVVFGLDDILNKFFSGMSPKEIGQKMTCLSRDVVLALKSLSSDKSTALAYTPKKRYSRVKSEFTDNETFFIKQCQKNGIPMHAVACILQRKQSEFDHDFVMRQLYEGLKKVCLEVDIIMAFRCAKHFYLCPKELIESTELETMTEEFLEYGGGAGKELLRQPPSDSVNGYSERVRMLAFYLMNKYKEDKAV